MHGTVGLPSHKETDLVLEVEGLRPVIGFEPKCSRLRGMCGTVGLSWLDVGIQAK